MSICTTRTIRTVFFLSIALCKRLTDAMTCQQRPKSTMYTNVEYKNEILLNNI